MMTAFVNWFVFFPFAWVNNDSADFCGFSLYGIIQHYHEKKGKKKPLLCGGESHIVCLVFSLFTLLER